MRSLNPSDAGIDSLMDSVHFTRTHSKGLNPSDAGIDSLIENGDFMFN